MQNKILLIFIAVLILAAAYLNYMPDERLLSMRVFQNAEQFAALLTIYLLASNSGLLYSKWTWPLLAGIFLVAIGTMIKILHWFYANPILATGFAIVSVTYTLRFLKKPEKIRLDYLKWMWVLSTIAVRSIVIFHWSGEESRHWLLTWRPDSYLLLLCLLDFIYTGYKNKTLFAD
jgi:hypothetical protein